MFEWLDRCLDAEVAPPPDSLLSPPLVGNFINISSFIIDHRTSFLTGDWTNTHTSDSWILTWRTLNRRVASSSVSVRLGPVHLDVLTPQLEVSCWTHRDHDSSDSTSGLAERVQTSPAYGFTLTTRRKPQTTIVSSTAGSPWSCRWRLRRARRNIQTFQTCDIWHAWRLSREESPLKHTVTEGRVFSLNNYSLKFCLCMTDTPQLRPTTGSTWLSANPVQSGSFSGLKSVSCWHECEPQVHFYTLS